MNKLDQKDFHPSQRGWFAGHLYNKMIDNPDIIVVTADLGYGQFDKIRVDFPDRFINVGAAEQSMIDIAVGLALSGKIPVVYTITSFYLRAAEAISLYINHEKISVKMVGGGRDDDYSHHDGFSHDCTPAQDFINSMTNIRTYYPAVNKQILTMMDELLASDKPSFISVKR